jgi:MFS family permease
LGFNFPQVFIASRVQRLPRKKALLLRTAMGQRLPWLLLSFFSLLLLDHLSVGAALVMFLSLYALAAVGGSLNLPVWFDLIAKLTPVQSRGRLFAARTVGGAALGIAGGGVVTFVLGGVPYPRNYALLLLLAFLVMMVSYAFLLSLREETDSETTQERRGWRSVFSAGSLLRADRNFRNYLVADALLISSSMANAFFAVHALEKFSLTDAFAGTVTIAMMVSMIVSSLLFGHLADRYGHKINLVLSAAATALACGSALVAPSPAWYLVAFLGSAAAVAVAMISRLPLIAELAPEASRASSVALANLVTSPFVLFGVLAGWMANRFGYPVVFSVAGSMALVALIWLILRVSEPRPLVLARSTATAADSAPQEM